MFDFFAYEHPIFIFDVLAIAKDIFDEFDDWMFGATRIILIRYFYFLVTVVQKLQNFPKQILRRGRQDGWLCSTILVIRTTLHHRWR